MIVRKNGIYKTIDSSEYGIYLEKGFVKVIDHIDMPKEEKVEVEPVIEIQEEIPVEEIIEPEPEIPVITEEEPVIPKTKSGRKGRNK